MSCNHIEEINKIIRPETKPLWVNDKVKLTQLKDSINGIYVSQFEKDYIKAIIGVLIDGISSDDRTGVGTIRSTFGQTLGVINEVPLLRGKFVSVQNAFVEACWIMLGKTDDKFLSDNKVNYWKPWLKPELENGEGYGKIYGHQMRNQSGFDQLLYVIKYLAKQPYGRQGVINLWHGADLKEQALPCCHVMYHPLIFDNNKMVLHITQRSADSFIGVPYDYLLFYFFGRVIAYWLGVDLIGTRITFNDFHIYKNQLESINTYLENVFTDPDKVLQTYRNDLTDIGLLFPDKNVDTIKELTSEKLTEWLQVFFDANIKAIKSNTNNWGYGKIKTPIAV